MTNRLPKISDKHKICIICEGNGLARLSSIFKEVPKIDISKCWLRRDTDWIGNAQRKGVCHFLVKDEFIKGWVKADDDQSI